MTRGADMWASARRRVLWGVGLVTALALLSATGARAHSPDRIDRYPDDPPSLWTVETFFDKSVPGGRTRSRIRGGARPWNKLGRTVFFSTHRPAISGAGYGSCQTTGSGRPMGVIYWQTVDGQPPPGKPDTLGVESHCYWNPGRPHAGRMAGFTMVYDSKQPNWYRRTGNAPNGKADLLSVATHEFGHATGWNGHYGEGDDKEMCATDNMARQTMCALYVLGQTRTRTLGRHDKHTVRGAYPAR